MSATANLARTLDALTSDDADVMDDTAAARRMPVGVAEQVQRRAVACRRCGDPIVVRWAEVVSSHRTSQGTVAYVRCACGGLGISLPVH
jgi:hypothetical protein